MDRNDNKFDKELKDKLNKEVNFIPDNINKAFDEAIEKGIKAKQKKSYKRIAQIAAGFIAVVLVFGFSVSPYARNIPILKNIYETFNRKTYENYDKYASDINITKESRGVSITINKVIYDGLDLEVFYTIESDKAMKERTLFFANEVTMINGKEVGFSSSSGGEFLDSNKVYVGSTKYNVRSSSMLPQEAREQNASLIDIPDEFIFTLKIRKVEFSDEATIKGKWEFDIPVSNTKLKGETIEKDINVDFSDIQENLKINKLIITPINTAIQGSTSYNNGNNNLQFSMWDSNGRYVLPKGAEASGYYNSKQEYSEYFNYKFKELNEETESITIIPYLWIIQNSQNINNEGSNEKLATKEIESKEVKLITIPLSLDGETNLKTADGEDYGTITKVEVKEDRTYIHFKPTIGNYDIFEKIVDDNNDINVSYPVDNYYRNEQTNTRYNKETGEFIIEFTKPLIIDGNYSISYFDKSGSEVYFFDKVITVDVK